MIIARYGLSTALAVAPHGASSLEDVAGGLDLESLAWQDAALCAEIDSEIFYPDLGQSAAPAKRICAACAVRPECLAYALERGERFGVWGGKSERERRRMRGAQQAA